WTTCPIASVGSIDPETTRYTRAGARFSCDATATAAIAIASTSPTQPAICQTRLARGGVWLSDEQNCLSAKVCSGPAIGHYRRAAADPTRNRSQLDRWTGRR